MQRLRCLVLKEFLELRQNPRLFGLVIVAPIIQLTMLGYAATTDITHVPIVVVDGDRSPQSRRLLERFSASPYFTILAERMDPREVDADLARGGAWLAIEEYDDVLADGVASFPLPIGAMPGMSTAREGKPINDIST